MLSEFPPSFRLWVLSYICSPTYSPAIEPTAAAPTPIRKPAIFPSPGQIEPIAEPAAPAAKIEPNDEPNEPKNSLLLGPFLAIVYAV